MSKAAIAAAAILIGLAAPAWAAEPGSVSAERGRIQLFGAAQFWFQWAQADPGAGRAGVEQFQTRRLQVGLHGRPSEHFEYHLSFALRPETPVVPDDAGLQVDVYEAYLEAVLSKTWRVRAGSFLPPWTLTMARPVDQLDFIRYPLIVDSGAWLFTPWQQTGIMASVKSGEKFFFAFGWFNGLDNANRPDDNDTMHDLMASAAFEFYPGLRVSIGHWGGDNHLRRITLKPGETAILPFGLTTKNTGAADLNAGGGVVDQSSTWLALEFRRGGFYGGAEALWNYSTRGGQALRDCFGYQVSLSYGKDWWQALFRYEQLDPDTGDLAGGSDELEWTTLGFNFILNPHCRLMANYIFKSERGQNQRANDEFLAQVSLGF